MQNTANVGLVERIVDWVAVLSAATSALALVAVAVSLRLQNKQVRTGQIEVHLGFHIDLMRTAIERPHLRSVWGQGMYPPSSHEWEISVYRNLVFRYLLLSRHLDIGGVSNDLLGTQLRVLLSTPDAREWWTKVRHLYVGEKKAKRDRDFFSLVEAAWAATAEDQPGPGKVPDDLSRDPTQRYVGQSE